MKTRGTGLCFLALMWALSGGCSVDIHGATGWKPPGPTYTARANTERHGTGPTGVSMRYTHTRDGQPASAEQTPTVTSNGDQHTATVTPVGAPAFAAFDKVEQKWRVNFNSWGQGSSHSGSETVLIDPVLSLIVSPDPLTAGQNGSGTVSLGHARTAGDVPVALEVTDQPASATVTLQPSVVTIPVNSTATGGAFTITTVETPPPSGTSVGGTGSGNANSCEITATITLPGLPVIKKTARFRVQRP